MNAAVTLEPASGEPDLHAKLALLRAWLGGDAVPCIETHASWVLVGRDTVCKLKKPVRFPFLDFSTLEARERCCRDEVRLNARLARGVYLGVRALQWDGRRLGVGPLDGGPDAGAAIDWIVVMRRLPEARMLDRGIAAGTVSTADIDALLEVLGRFYRDAIALPLSAEDYVARFHRAQAANREVLLRPQFDVRHAALALDRLDRAQADRVELLYERCAGGRIVEGHGDLRPEHVCLLAPPVVIDCIEFNAGLRQVDPFDEIAYLGLECESAGAAWIGPRLADGLARALDDHPPASLRALYTAHRAMLRARLAMAHLLDAAPRSPQAWPPLAERCVQRALAALDDVEGYCPLPDAAAEAAG